MRERDDLPLPDYNQLQVGSLTSRIRTLGADDLQTLISYERSHAKRVQVMAVMENRLTSLKAGANPPAGTRPRDARVGTGRGRRIEGLRGDVRPAGQPAVPRRPDSRASRGSRADSYELVVIDR